MKACSKCGKEKELTEFGNYSLGRKGPKAYCRECETNQARRRRAANKIRNELAAVARIQGPKTKYCPRCKERKDVEKFPIDRGSKTGRHVYCQACVTQYHREYVAMNPQMADREKSRLATAAYRQRNREELKRRLEGIKDTVFAAYGGYRCVCCGVAGKFFCTLDHVDSSRKNMGDHGPCEKGGGKNFYRALLARQFPPGFQVLCWNCNCAKHLNGGICPHKQVAA